MTPKVGPSIDLPTTDPWWDMQRLVDHNDLTQEEIKLVREQYGAIATIERSFKEPIRKGDLKAARARVDTLLQLFEQLSPENKKFVYEKLQTDTGLDSLANDFKYRLSTLSRDLLLKTLNPDHKEEHIKKYTIDDARQKAQKSLEMNMQGTSQLQEMNTQAKEVLDKLGR